MLGPLEVRRRRRARPGCGSGQAARPAPCLLLRANGSSRATPDRRAVGRAPPPTAAKALQQVLALRKRLGRERIATAGPATGWARPGELDVVRFEGRSARAASSRRAREEAAATLREALALRRGRPRRRRLRGASPRARSPGSRSCASRRSRSGSRPTSRSARHVELVAELEALVAGAPAARAAAGQLMLALYRAAGRPRRWRSTGARAARSATSSASIRAPSCGELQRAILRQDAASRVEPPSSARAATCPRRRRRSSGAARELAEVDDLLARRRPPRDADGPGRHRQDAARPPVAHELADAFPDGVFFVDLAPPAGARARPGRDRARARGRGARGAAARETPLRVAARRLLLLLDNFETSTRPRRSWPTCSAAPGPRRARHEPGAAAALASTSTASRPCRSTTRPALRARGRASRPASAARARGGGGRGDLPAPRLPAARDRARRGAHARTLAGRAAALLRARARDGRRARPARAPAHAAGHDRLEPRPARAARAGALRPPGGVQRRLHPRGRRGSAATRDSSRRSSAAACSTGAATAALRDAGDGARVRARAARGRPGHRPRAARRALRGGGGRRPRDEPAARGRPRQPPRRGHWSHDAGAVDLELRLVAALAATGSCAATFARGSGASPRRSAMGPTRLSLRARFSAARAGWRCAGRVRAGRRARRGEPRRDRSLGDEPGVALALNRLGAAVRVPAIARRYRSRSRALYSTAGSATNAGSPSSSATWGTGSSSGRVRAGEALLRGSSRSSASC